MAEAISADLAAESSSKPETAVASSFCARMSADLLGEGEAGGSMEEVLADVRKEWEVVAKTLFHGLYLGMNDLGMHLSSRCACAVEPRP